MALPRFHRHFPRHLWPFLIDVPLVDHLRDGAPATPPYLGSAHAASSCLLPAYPIGTPLGRNPATPDFHGHACATSDRLPPTHSVVASFRKVLLTPDPIGTPTAPPVASYRYASQRPIQCPPVDVSPRGAFPRLPPSAVLMRSPVVP